MEAIQDKAIKRLGGTKTISLDFRLITATNRDLSHMVKRGSFREDLYYRINVLPIKLPPLRERQEDIPLLIHHFLTKFKAKYNLEKNLTNEAISLLCRYEWPGNVRELQNLIERLLVLTEGERIRDRDVLVIFPNLSLSALSLSAAAEVHSGHEYLPVQINFTKIDNIDLPDTLREIEKVLIQNALLKFGSTRNAARHLKISQSALMRRLAAFKIKISNH